MEKPQFPPPEQRSVKLDQHDSVRSHVQQQICDEVQRLERRIETLRLTKAPHAAIMISTYERMICRKRAFCRTGTCNRPSSAETIATVGQVLILHSRTSGIPFPADWHSLPDC